MIYKISLFFFYFFLIEVSLFFIVNILKKDFKWIVTSKDEKPSFEEKRLSNFYKKSFDKILGWDRKKILLGMNFLIKNLILIFQKWGIEEFQDFHQTR